MSIKLLTFGSHANYIDAGKRLLDEASRLNVFTETRLVVADDLKQDPDFWDAHHIFINNNRRGYGYWLWKSYIIDKTMKDMHDGDILLYLDCGCEIDHRKKGELLECIDIVKTDKIVGTTTYMERDWNKMDLIEKLDMNKEMYMNSQQHQAGALLFLVCFETRCLVNEWYKLCCDYNNIDDSPSIKRNFPCFKEHRHDQSVFSLLSKKYNLYSGHSLLSAINYSRNRTGISRIA